MLIGGHWAYYSSEKPRQFFLPVSLSSSRLLISSCFYFSAPLLVVQTVRRATCSLPSLPLQTKEREREKEKDSSMFLGVLLAWVRRSSKHCEPFCNVAQTNGKFELPCDGNRLQFDEIAGSTRSERSIVHCSPLLHFGRARCPFSHYS